MHLHAFGRLAPKLFANSAPAVLLAHDDANATVPGALALIGAIPLVKRDRRPTACHLPLCLGQP